MSYEFNPDSSSLDFPNPFVVENYFLFAAAAFQCMGAVAVLMVCRFHVESDSASSTAVTIITGIILLVSGLNHARCAMMQLRFFFGRSKPIGLAPEFAPGMEGTTQAAENLKRIVRQNAIEYPEPTGPMNGVLYSWIPNLIYAPVPIQRLAQRQFHNSLAILVTLFSFVISSAGFSSIASAAWMGLFYFGFSLFLLLRPLESSYSGKADVGIRTLVVLVLCAIFAPVLIPMVTIGLPNISWLSLEGQTLFLLLASLASVGLFFRALLLQMNNPPQTNPAFEQMSLSMNCHPNQLIDELDRKLQQEWTKQIPNRRYCKISPAVAGGSGSFHAELLEETQPMAAGDLNKIDLSSAFSVQRFLWIASLDSLGLILIAVAAFSLIAFAMSPQLVVATGSMAPYLALGLAAMTLGGFCLRVGHQLWGRFDFKSQLVWIFMEGNYQSAKLAFGNQFTDRIKTQKQIINIETMTLRVWVAELHSVIFGRDSQRFVTALHGIPARASELATHLSRFAGEQSMIISPSAKADLQKAALLGALNHSGDGVDTRLQHSLIDAVVEAQTRCKTAPVMVQAEAIFCDKCKTPVPSGDRFCSMCGSTLTLP